jgi:Protein of unknown function (DUF2752)
MDQPSPPPSLSKNAQRWRWAFFVVSCAPILGAFIYQWGLQLPHKKCFFQSLFHFPSPSCGLTRSFMAIARGDLPQALAYHLFGPLLFSLLLFTTLYITIELSTGKALTTSAIQRLQQPQNLISGGILFTTIFFGYYCLRLYVRYNIDPIAFDLSHLNLWQSFVAGAQAL